MKTTTHTVVECSFRVKCNFRSGLHLYIVFTLWSNEHCRDSTLTQPKAQFQASLLDASKQKLWLSLGPDVSEASSNFQPPSCTCSSLKGPNNSVLSPAVDIRVSSQCQTWQDKQNLRNLHNETIRLTVKCYDTWLRDQKFELKEYLTDTWITVPSFYLDKVGWKLVLFDFFLILL